MEIYDSLRAVKYKNGYFVTYVKKTPKEAGLASFWQQSQTYLTPEAAVLENPAHADLIPAYLESKRKSQIVRPKDSNE